MEKSYSIILQSKIPSFIRDDPSYSRFIEFFEHYYDWFNDTYKINGFGDNIDIDAGYSEFLNYFQADFLPYFPKEFQTDKVKLIKIVRELYKTKGIPDSFKFLFRALYDSYCELTPTVDFVFKASDGKWIVPKSIKIKSTDSRFLNINNLKIFGVQSQTIGLVESSKLVGNRIQIYLSNIERLYFSSEQIKLLDGNNKEVYFLNGSIVQYDSTPPIGSEPISSKIIGSLSNITIDSKYRGETYKVGDPVVIIGGVNPEITNPVKASAKISEVTSGIITGVKINNGGYGFDFSPNTAIDVIYNNSIDSVANCVVALVDGNHPANINYFPIDSIANNYTIVLSSNNYNFHVSNTIGLNSKLSDAFLFTQYVTYPISSVVVQNGGGGYDTKPTLEFTSLFQDDLAINHNLKNFGILAPIQIINAGENYSTNDSISIIGGDGKYAFAKISSVNAAGSILSVDYYKKTTEDTYTVGGMGYNNLNLPTISIISSNGSNASLIVPSILGDGVNYTLETNRIGSITKIQLTETGEDYVNAPNVSLKILDLVVSNVTVSQAENIVAYQGDQSTPLQSTYYSYIDFITKIDDKSLNTFLDDLYLIRTYNYRGEINNSQPLKLFDLTSRELITQYTIQNDYNESDFVNGVKIYGDGTAKATAKFLNGLIIGDGKYLNSDGQPSTYSFLQSDIYNQSTYFLSSEKDYESYKNVALNLVHPTGSRLIPRNLIRSAIQNDLASNSKFSIGATISNSSISIVHSSNAQVLFSNTYHINGNTHNFSVNNAIFINTTNNMNVYSTVKSIDNSNNIIILNDFTQYKYINVYSGLANSNTIIIQQVNYKESKYDSNNFIFVGDELILLGNSYPVVNVENSLITVNTNIELITGQNTQPISVLKNISSNTILNYTLV